MLLVQASLFTFCIFTVCVRGSENVHDETNAVGNTVEEEKEISEPTNSEVDSGVNYLSRDSSDQEDDLEEFVEFVHLGTNTNAYGIIINNVKSSNRSVNNTAFQVSCLETSSFFVYPVEVVNTTRLAAILQIEPNVTTRQSPGKCTAVLFFSPTCPFSCQAAPHFNALARYFPHIKMAAVDAMTYRNLNGQYGVFGVPTLILFHNGKPAARLNKSTLYRLDMLSKFIQLSTNMKPVARPVVTSFDFYGPVPSVLVKENDYYLLLSWIVIALHVLYHFYRSSWGQWLLDATLSAWREAEAQHHHND